MSQMLVRIVSEPQDETPPLPRSVVNLHKLEAELTRNSIAEIKTLIGALTYGEMIELAGAVWAIKGEAAITEETLPGILHKWSKT